ncbi:DUF402 domain-containing protein [Microbacterium sp. ARD32]|uniref:DUF402 domain-containing protein n=1 Tax=Microbacterium sp. ARD32 TaxID=2962577 RepID=UPI002880DB39|nr:DUF402 domain-containing protein [Microbacterium sp. ARD32]MDT0157227.1 DUF402 domain-containing protein [Microbacterium sp. ARD32]
MRLPLGSSDVSASGGTVTLVGRRGDAWAPLLAERMPLTDAIDLLADQHDGAHPGVELANAVAAGSAEAERFAPGQVILWRYGKWIETARVVRDDERGLVAWIPSGSARLESVPADGRRTRDVPLAERFSVARTVRESVWRGPGVVRAAPHGRPWSVWFFRRADGTPDGAYVNLELPHLRSAASQAHILSRDLILDLWIDAQHAGEEDIWLKDADELGSAVAQGRFTSAQADAVRAIADHAVAELIMPGAWPLDEGWERWVPDAAMDQPILLPHVPFIRDALGRGDEAQRER